MNVAFYLEAFDHNIGDFFRYIGITRKYRLEQNVATYCGDFHIHYVRELFEGTPIEITCQLVGFDEKRIQVCQSMYSSSEGYLAAESEVIYLHIDSLTRRVAMKSDLSERLKVIHNAHSSWRPRQQGRLISIKNDIALFQKRTV